MGLFSVPNANLSTLTAPTSINVDLLTATSSIGLGSTSNGWNKLVLAGSTSGFLTQQATALTTSYTIHWPATQGGASTVLQNDGSGNLSWATVSGGGSSSGIAGSVQFSAGSGAFNSDATNFFWNNSTKALTVGTISALNGSSSFRSPINITQQSGFAIAYINFNNGTETAYVGIDNTGLAGLAPDQLLLLGTNPVNIASGGALQLTVASTGVNVRNQNLVLSHHNPKIQALEATAGNELEIDGGTTDYSQIYVYDGEVDIYAGQNGNGVIQLAATQIYVSDTSNTTEAALMLFNRDGNNAISIKAPNPFTSYTLTLPVDDGTPGQVLSTDGTGVLSWATASGLTGPFSTTHYTSDYWGGPLWALLVDSTNADVLADGGATFQSTDVVTDIPSAELGMVAGDMKANGASAGGGGALFFVAGSVTGTTTTAAAGNISFNGGNVVNGTGSGGGFSVTSGNTSGGTVSPILFQTGTGAGSVRGPIQFKNGSEGTSGYVWTSTDISGSGAWMPATGGGGANTALSNLASTAVNTTIAPDSSNNWDLGASGFLWGTLFVSAITAEAGALTLHAGSGVLPDGATDLGSITSQWNNIYASATVFGTDQAQQFNLLNGSLAAVASIVNNATSPSGATVQAFASNFNESLSIFTQNITAVAEYFVLGLGPGAAAGANFVTGGAGYYFQFYTLTPSPALYYVWVNTGTETDPGPGGTGYMATVSTSDNSNQVAIAIASALGTLVTAGYLTANAVGNSVQIQMLNVGAVTPPVLDPAAVSAGVFEIASYTAGVSAISGNVSLETGNVSGGSNISGNVLLRTGSAAGTRGDIILDAPLVRPNGSGVTNIGNPANFFQVAFIAELNNVASDLGLSIDVDNRLLVDPTASIKLDWRTDFAISTPASSTAASHHILGTTGDCSWDDTTAASGDVQLRTGAITAATQVAKSGDVVLQTGNASAVSASGNIVLQIGTVASGPRGHLVYSDGSESAGAGYVLTLLDTVGRATWMAPATNLKQLTVLSGTDITNQYVDLAHVAKTDSIDFLVLGGGVQIEGASYDYSVSYTGGAGGNTRITFLNGLATGGGSALIAGDVVVIKYEY